MFFLRSILPLLTFLNLAISTPNSSASLSTYLNSILPGWHSDPSCIYVSSHKTFYCCTSTFIITSGLPIYASKDLVNWKLISHALVRPSQAPYMYTSTNQNSGIFAPTLRYHDGVFYLVSLFRIRVPPRVSYGLIFKTTNPYRSAAWSEPVEYPLNGIDPDLFWDPKDGQAYLPFAGITGLELQTIDLETGAVGNSTVIWEGSGGLYPEGPYIYYKDSWYYLLIGEGGTETNHSVTIARAKSVWGSYESYKGNPILTARGTDNYFQTVGHADLFQDGDKNWWAVALSTRSGPKWVNYPMGRETILTLVTWEKGEWPKIEPVYGNMVLRDRKLPRRSKDIRGGDGDWIGENDVIDFKPGEKLPAHLVTWRWPALGAWEVSPKGKPGTLKLKPSKVITSATGDEDAGLDGLSLLMRLQTDTLFTFSVEIDFSPQQPEEEAGVTVFLTQKQHIDLGVVNLEKGGKLVQHLRLRGVTVGSLGYVEPFEDVVKVISRDWQGAKIGLEIRAKSDTNYTFSASLYGEHGKAMVLGSAPATIVTGGSGQYTGSLVGIYASSNNGTGSTPAFFSKWRYNGDGQKIDNYQIVPSW